MAQTENQVAAVAKQEVAAAIGNSTIADSILNSFSKLAAQGQLSFPKGYAVGNQLKLMYTSLSQNGMISKATPVSIGEALVEAVIQGLEVDKRQVYFIVYGNKLQMFRSYYGDIKVALETGLVRDIRARVIYEGDEYDIDTNSDGEEIVINHRTRLENHDKPIVGAYAWADCPDGKRHYCIMTKKEIDTNWSKSKDPSRNVQKDFPQEMAKRTVIRRLVKMIFNTAPSELTEAQKTVIRSYNKTTEDEYENTPVNYAPAPAKGVKKVVVDDDGSIVGDNSNEVVEEQQEPIENENPSDEEQK